jgi:SAM-dependent methyltransferase
VSNWLTPENNLGETATCREYLAHWCTGAGLDIGFGGAAPIVESAICIDRDGVGPHGAWAHWSAHLILDAFRPLPFEDSSLDYIYSSHCLEDAVDTSVVLKEWCRAIKVGGHLVLFLPDQPTYVHCCRIYGRLPNQDHKHPTFSLDYVIARMPMSMTVIHSAFPVGYNPYSFELVAVKR